MLLSYVFDPRVLAEDAPYNGPSLLDSPGAQKPTGSSGTPIRRSRTIVAGTTLLASIHRQLSSPSPAIPAVTTYATAAPTNQIVGGADSTGPRCLRGVNSAIYGLHTA